MNDAHTPSHQTMPKSSSQHNSMNLTNDQVEKLEELPIPSFPLSPTRPTRKQALNYQSKANESLSPRPLPESSASPTLLGRRKVRGLKLQKLFHGHHPHQWVFSCWRHWLPWTELAPTRLRYQVVQYNTITENLSCQRSYDNRATISS